MSIEWEIPVKVKIALSVRDGCLSLIMDERHKPVVRSYRDEWGYEKEKVKGLTVYVREYGTLYIVYFEVQKTSDKEVLPIRDLKELISFSPPNFLMTAFFQLFSEILEDPDPFG